MIRYSIPLVAILAGLAASASRSSLEGAIASGTARAERSTSIATAVEAALAAEPDLRPVPAAVRAGSSAPALSAPAISVAEPHVGNRPILLALLERELSLTPDQRVAIDRVFAFREREIDAHHRQLRAVGALSGDAYHRHMQGLRALSYIQIGQQLDGEQHRKFLALVASGALNDLIAFPMEEGMVELD